MTLIDRACSVDVTESSRRVLNAAATEAGRCADELIGTGPLPGTVEWDAEQGTEIPAQRMLAWQLVSLRVQFGAGLDCIETVIVLRTMAVSWEVIGRAVGMTRQAAHERWGARVKLILAE
ncbi:hypothetical protein [Gordonia neofelifaecis]|uniref:Uncharacterized protein n=1 Tax=Gordonia neofelifaecis NRRL B-59395 TaxID=644548 RepID=F1YFP4_9ACTN|nr:hypothetical protein [Gordonia neofelifaecis]EGD56676.1 hypothetical protein SCNU_03957 [Gordonia neofelifaecis NRRL B-59395]